jgi:hypothetical protein
VLCPLQALSGAWRLTPCAPLSSLLRRRPWQDVWCGVGPQQDFAPWERGLVTFEPIMRRARVAPWDAV